MLLLSKLEVEGAQGITVFQSTFASSFWEGEEGPVAPCCICLVEAGECLVMHKLHCPQLTALGISHILMRWEVQATGLVEEGERMLLTPLSTHTTTLPANSHGVTCLCSIGSLTQQLWKLIDTRMTVRWSICTKSGKL